MTLTGMTLVWKALVFHVFLLLFLCPLVSSLQEHCRGLEAVYSTSVIPKTRVSMTLISSQATDQEEEHLHAKWAPPMERFRI